VSSDLALVNTVYQRANLGPRLPSGMTAAITLA